MTAMIQVRPRRTLWPYLAIALLILGSGLFFFWYQQPAPPAIELKLLSSRPDFVSGGDLLLEIRSEGKVRPKDLRFRLDRRKIRPRIRWTRGKNRRLVAKVRGISTGKHKITAKLRGRWSRHKASQASLKIRNYPSQGPMISGPHERPFVCETERFRDVHGEPLGPPKNKKTCEIDPAFRYVYLNHESQFKAWPKQGRPKDIRKTKSGRPFIVRVETGTVNRAIYEIAMLHDPQDRKDPKPSAWTRSRGWNGKLIYTHGGGCRRGWYRQGSRTGGVLRETLLEQGYALASASLNVFGQNCNDLLASETHMMVKERFIENYGPPLWTMGTGGSGGSYQCHQSADNFPGIFDGILVSLSFPDALSSTIFTLADARLLHHYFSELADPPFSDEAIQAVSGFARAASLPSLSSGAARIVALPLEDQPWTLRGAEYDSQFPEKLRFSTRNPRGARATVYDHMAYALGRERKTGRVGRPLDNVGVQYGLAALQQGAINVEQFLDLNARIGGFNPDGRIVPQRHRANKRASQRALASGRITRAQGGLLETPTINMRRYTDERSRGDVHMLVHQFSMRARLEAAGSDFSQYHMVIRDDRASLTPEERESLSPVERNQKINDRYREVFIPLFLAMDEWLTKIAQDQTQDSKVEKVRRHRPASLKDGCWIRDEAGQEKFVEDSFQERTTSPCLKHYPLYSTPRMVAGAPLANDIVKCELRSPRREDYPKAMKASQWARLKKIFPRGVCDFDAPGKFSTPYAGPWKALPPIAARRR